MADKEPGENGQVGTQNGRYSSRQQGCIIVLLVLCIMFAITVLIILGLLLKNTNDILDKCFVDSGATTQSFITTAAPPPPTTTPTLLPL